MTTPEQNILQHRVTSPHFHQHSKCYKLKKILLNDKSSRGRKNIHGASTYKPRGGGLGLTAAQVEGPWPWHCSPALISQKPPHAWARDSLPNNHGIQFDLCMNRSGDIIWISLNGESEIISFDHVKLPHW